MLGLGESFKYIRNSALMYNCAGKSNCRIPRARCCAIFFLVNFDNPTIVLTNTFKWRYSAPWLKVNLKDTNIGGQRKIGRGS